MNKTKVEAMLSQVWTETCGKKPEGNSTLKSLGASSLSYMLVKRKIHERFGIDIKITELFKLNTFNLQLTLIYERLFSTSSED